MKNNNDSFNRKTVVAQYRGLKDIFPLTIYEFIDLYKDLAFYVCNVSEDDYIKICSQMDLNGMALKNHKCNFDEFRYLMANDIKNEIIRIADCDKENINGSYYINKEGTLCYDDRMLKFYKDPKFAKEFAGVKIYTTETYQDIINFYEYNDNVKKTL